MSNTRPTVDLGYPTEPHGKIPAFHSIEEEAAFWDSHDMGEFTEEFAPAEITVSPDLAEKLTLRLDRADREALTRHARKKGIGPSTLARMWLKEHLRHEAEDESRAS